MKNDFFFFAERVKNKSTGKMWDPAGIRTQDLLNITQTLLPLSHLDPWQTVLRESESVGIQLRPLGNAAYVCSARVPSGFMVRVSE